MFITTSRRVIYSTWNLCTAKCRKRALRSGGGSGVHSAAARTGWGMEHTAKGAPKILKKCNLPLTAVKEVDMIVTEMAVMVCGADGLTLTELAPGVTLEQVQAATEADLRVSSQLKIMGR